MSIRIFNDWDLCSACNDASILNLAHLWVIYPGEHDYPLSEKISVSPLKDIAALPKQLR
jgi:hypothetical protein